MSITSRIIDLDDRRAANPAIVGAKAASLYVSKAAGLPVLPGVIVPIAEGSSTVAAASEVLAERGSGGARLALAQHQLDHAMCADLIESGTRLGTRLVVRSSAIREGEAVWAGAFASYAEISPDELPRAVVGCWASIFTEDALARGRASGVGPGAVAMAVLVQPEIRSLHGGVATTSEEGTVTVVGAAGSPAPIVAGWEPGEVVTVDADGCITARADPIGIDAALLIGVAEIARNTLHATGFDLIEWAEDDEGIWLVQAGAAAALHPTGSEVDAPQSDDPRLTAVAVVVADCPGPVGEVLVLPWALGLAQLPAPIAPDHSLPPGRLFDDARQSAAVLTEQMWGTNAELKALLAALRGPDPVPALDRIAALAAPDLLRGGRILGLLERLAHMLTDSGAIPKSSALAHLPLDEIEALASGKQDSVSAGGRIGRGRWEPFLHGAVSALGVTTHGVGVVPGPGAGRLRLVRNSEDAADVEPREIVVAFYPINNLAPLLWEAAAIVTVAGGRGAHLFEVAGSLAVPAVCGVDVERVIEAPLAALTERTFFGSVDGATGAVTILHSGVS